MFFQDRFPRELSLEPVQRPGLPLCVQDAGGLRPALVDGRDEESAARLRVKVRLRRRLKDRRGAIDFVFHRRKPPGQRVFDRALDGEHFLADQVADRVGRVFRPGRFFEREHFVFQAQFVFVEQGSFG